MNDPRVDNIIEELAARMRQPVPLDETEFPQRLDESAHSGMETGPSQERGPDVRQRHPFEVHVIGYTNEAQTTARVMVARGNVLTTEDDVGALGTISDIDTAQTLANGERLWLQMDFSKGGGLSNLRVIKGTTWGFYPALYRESGSGGNDWVTLIAQARPSKTGKSGGEEPDSGEFPEIETSIKIAQKTHTHLAVARLCVGASRKLVWGLVPSSGGID